MSNKPKGVWGINPQYPNQSDNKKKRPPGQPKPVKSKRKHGRPLKDNDVSDGGGEAVMILILLFIFLLIVLFLW
jgi:hypothetical protein